MSLLKRYQKQNIEKLDTMVTSVSIEKAQKMFLDQYGINLSLVVREAIDSLINIKTREVKNATSRKK